jgi:hypothetical protein
MLMSPLPMLPASASNYIHIALGVAGKWSSTNNSTLEPILHIK